MYAKICVTMIHLRATVTVTNVGHLVPTFLDGLSTEQSSKDKGTSTQ